MATTPTQVPVPSELPRDLKFNAGKIDEFVTSMAKVYEDRFGQKHYTIEGLRWIAQEAIAAFGYITLDSFQDGANLTLPNQVLRWELPDGDGEYYRWDGMLPKSVPSGSTPGSTGGIGAGAWLAIGDAVLRTELTSDNGANLIGTSTGEKVQDKLDEHGKRLSFTVFIDDYPGVVGDGVSDDSAGIQAAILDVAMNGGGTVLGAQNRAYCILTKVLIPSNVQMDFRWATIKGNRTTNTQPMFETATLEEGVLVSNIDSEPETRLVWNTVFRNAYVEDAYLFFRALNFLKGCVIENMEFRNCRQVIYGERCFYSSYINILVMDGSLVSTPAFNFVDQNNAMYFERVTTTVDWAFNFATASTALVFNNCTFEGGKRGYVFSGECHSLTWTGCYFESVQGILFDFTSCSLATVNMSGNYLNKIDVVIQDTQTAGTYVFGEFDESNSLVNVGVTESGFTYRGLFNLQGGGTLIKVRQHPDITSDPSLPSTILVSPGGTTDYEKIVVRQGTGFGDVLSKGIISGGVIPLRYSGNTGRTFSNQVAFCTHQAFSPGNPTVVILLTTAIVLQDTTFAKFNLVVSSVSGDTAVFGDIYGTFIKRADTNTSLVTAISNAGGYLRLEIGPFSSANGVYALRGTVQICS